VEATHTGVFNGKQPPLSCVSAGLLVPQLSVQLGHLSFTRFRPDNDTDRQTHTEANRVLMESCYCNVKC
jgi:hypothetical protein